jgi:hypothetical protein
MVLGITIYVPTQAHKTRSKNISETIVLKKLFLVEKLQRIWNNLDYDFKNLVFAEYTKLEAFLKQF